MSNTPSAASAPSDPARPTSSPDTATDARDARDARDERREHAAPPAPELAVSAADLEDLGKRYGMDADLAEALREGFRELKRAPAEAKRLGALLHGLARKHESEGRHTVEEIERVVAAIQRPRGED